MSGCLTSIVVVFLVLWFLVDPNFAGKNNLSLLTPDNLVESKSTFVSVTDGEDFTWNFTFSRLFDRQLVYFDKFDFKAGKTAFTSFIALTEEDYREFLNITTCNTCPAPFLNRKTYMYSVIFDDKDVGKALKSCKRGDRISIYGNYLDFTVESDKYQDVNFTLPARSSFLYINSIKKI